MARAQRLECIFCEAKALVAGDPFCGKCGRPTEWATHEQRVAWEVEQWRGAGGTATAVRAPAAATTAKAADAPPSTTSTIVAPTKQKRERGSRLGRIAARFKRSESGPGADEPDQTITLPESEPLVVDVTTQSTERSNGHRTKEPARVEAPNKEAAPVAETAVAQREQEQEPSVPWHIARQRTEARSDAVAKAEPTTAKTGRLKPAAAKAVEPKTVEVARPEAATVRAGVEETDAPTAGEIAAEPAAAPALSAAAPEPAPKSTPAKTKATTAKRSKAAAAKPTPAKPTPAKVKAKAKTAKPKTAKPKTAKPKATRAKPPSAKSAKAKTTTAKRAKAATPTAPRSRATASSKSTAAKASSGTGKTKASKPPTNKELLEQMLHVLDRVEQRLEKLERAVVPAGGAALGENDTAAV